MFRMTVGTKIGLGFTLVFVILLVIGFVALQGTAKLIETAKWVAHTHEVLTELNKLTAGLNEAEATARGFFITNEAGFKEDYHKTKEKIESAIKEARRLTLDNRNQQKRLDEQFGPLVPLIRKKLANLDRHITERNDKDLVETGKAILKSEARGVLGTIGKEIGAMEDEEKELLTKRNEDAKDAERATYWTVGLGTGLAALFVAVGGFFLVRSITGPVRQAVSQLTAASAEIQATTTQQAAGAQEQAAAVAQTVTTVDQVTQTADQAAQRARGVGDAVQRTLEVGKAGRQAVDDSRAAMAQVKDQVEATAEGILALAEQAQQIGEIIATVNDIAEQTNLLALNAAIEASRAGEQGRGFAVVAGEVKALADQSKKATGQVRQILGEIQKATAQAVRATEDVTKGVAGAVRVGEQAGETIKALAEALTEAARATAQIAASVGQQATGMGQIHQAMRNIDQVAKQNATATRQAAQAAENLNALGNVLTRLTGK